MPLQSMVPMLKKAKAGKYAVGLFDAHSMEGVLAILEAAAEQRSPVIIAPFFVPRRPAAAMIRELVEDMTVPVSIELDHGRDFKAVMESIRAGFTDVMLDASTEPYEQNVVLTRQACEAAHAAGLGMEAEIGHVGRGEDYSNVEARKATFTRPEEAVQFIAETKVDILAVAIGSAHGVYKGEPELDLERLRQIAAKVDVPLVLHGGSGISDDDFRAAVANGISKINIYTNMALAAVDSMRKSLADPAANYIQIQRAMQGAIKEVVVHYMQVFGSAGKA
jgi:fructose-bisphosphate aldolase class II